MQYVLHPCTDGWDAPAAEGPEGSGIGRDKVRGKVKKAVASATRRSFKEALDAEGRKFDDAKVAKLLKGELQLRVGGRGISRG